MTEVHTRDDEAIKIVPGITGVISNGHTTFRPRARLIRLLGEELISDEAMAVSELVKNAYDADATEVIVRLVQVTDPDGGYIEIRDDGCGMSLQTVLNAWLEPATSFKRPGGRKQRTTGGRYLLGEKGVGRFAADKLGAQLELITRSASQPDEEVRLVVSWEDFVEGEYLDEVHNVWETREPLDLCADAHGTILRIRNLRTRWDHSLAERVQECLGRLVSPTERGDFTILFDAPDFSDLAGPVQNRLFETAPYRLSGTISHDGCFESEDGRMVDLREHAGDHFRTHRGRGIRRPTCGPFSISLSVWDLDVLGLSGVRLTRPLRALLRRTSGISIYRDSFRVAPYGDRGDDWLELNQRRVNNPTLRVSTNQIVGVVELTQEANPDLRDRTSREGLIETPALSDLKALVIAALTILEEERYASRKAAAPPPPEPGADPVLAWLERARSDGARGPALKTAIDSYRSYRREAERREEILLRLASAGAAAENLLGQLNGSVAALARMLPLVQKQAGHAAQLARIQQHVALLAQQLDALERIRAQGTQQVTRVDLRSVAQDAVAAYAPLLESASVQLSVDGPAGVIVKADRALVLQALLHLLENAILAAAEMSRNRWVEVTVESAPPRLVVRDSGYGVPIEKHDLIFDPFFSTREGRDGLGLFFARTIMQSGGNDLILAEGGDEFCLVFGKR